VITLELAGGWYPNCYPHSVDNLGFERHTREQAARSFTLIDGLADVRMIPKIPKTKINRASAECFFPNRGFIMSF
jgi:hypothetical protein